MDACVVDIREVTVRVGVPRSRRDRRAVGQLRPCLQLRASHSQKAYRSVSYRIVS